MHSCAARRFGLACSAGLAGRRSGGAAHRLPCTAVQPTCCPPALFACGASAPQIRTLIFSRTDGSRGGDAFQCLHDDVAAQFKEKAQGTPRVISTAQLVQMLFEVGAADYKTMTVGDVMDKLMWHGFYRQSNALAVDSYGPVSVPTVGLDECKMWATLFFSEHLKAVQTSKLKAAAPAAAPKDKRLDWAGIRKCKASACECGANGDPSRCVLVRKPWSPRQQRLE
eukprot:TRINITY_DN123689_c0_g1_i1.p1 TRINITY_DN123689_c0_g1~~TRINITY_DN123689_c0_g1_i1.p1  ORF type:complete len:225 (+),score=47.84 TRINITY_DN123689_c0_g1_i1:193-867(+)